MTVQSMLVAISLEQSDLNLAHRQAVENHKWDEAALLAGRILASHNRMIELFKEIDKSLVERVGRSHAETLAQLTGKYPEPARLQQRVITDAEDAIAAFARVYPALDQKKAAELFVAAAKKGAGAK